MKKLKKLFTSKRSELIKERADRIKELDIIINLLNQKS